MGIGSQFLGTDGVDFGSDWSDRVYAMQESDGEFAGENITFGVDDPRYSEAVGFGEDFMSEMVKALDSGDPYAIGQNVGGLGTVPGMTDIEDDVIGAERDQHRAHHGHHHKRHHPHHGGRPGGHHPGQSPLAAQMAPRAAVHGEYPGSYGNYPHRVPLVGDARIRAGDMGCEIAASSLRG